MVTDSEPVEAVHGPRRGPGRPRKTDTAPRTAAEKPAPAKRSPGRPRKALVSLQEPLEVSYRMIGQVLAFRDPVCGQALMDQAGDIARAWDTWAQSSPAVHKAISQLMVGGGAFGVAVAHLPLFFVVFQHHKPENRPVEQTIEYEYPGDPVYADTPADPYNGYAPASADNAR